VHDGIDIRPGFVDFAMDEAFEKTSATVGIAGLGIEAVFEDIVV
jgi:hypothetical protein